MKKILYLFCIFLLIFPLASALIVEEGVQFSPSNSNVIYNLTQNMNTTDINITDECVIIDDVRFNDSYCLTSDAERVIDLPNLNYSELFSNWTIIDENLTEGEEYTFEVDIEDGKTVSWAKWFIDGVKKATGLVWNWLIGFDTKDKGINNISLYVREEDNQAYRKDWYFSVNDNFQPPIIEDFFQTPLSVNFTNQTVSMFCNVSDLDSGVEELDVNMSYRLSTNNQWIDLEGVYSEVSEIWSASFKTNPLPEWITTLDFRCIAKDNESLLSSYQYDYDTVIVSGEQVAPTQPDNIEPNSGVFDVVMDIKCQGSYDANQDNFWYEIDAYMGDEWVGLGSHIPGNYYELDVSEIPFNSIKLRCKAKDNEGESGYAYTDNISIEHETNHYLYNSNFKKFPGIDDNVVMKAYCNTEYSDNLKIESYYLDCNSDDLIDYYQDYSNMTINYYNKKHNCVYEAEGIKKIKSECVLTRINNSIAWGKTCKRNSMDDDYCRLTRERSVTII